MTKIALQHLTRVVARDKDTWFSIHRKVIFNDGRVPIYPGAAHQTMRTALLDAMYWAHKGLDVYFANGAYLNAGEHKQGRPYPDCIRQNPNLIACKCLYMDVDVKEGAFGSTAEATAGDACVRARGQAADANYHGVERFGRVPCVLDDERVVRAK